MLSYLWNLLNDLSNLTILALIGVTIADQYFPSQVIVSCILSFSQLDIIPTELFYDKIFTFDEDDDTPLNNLFEELGWGTNDTIRNLGSSLIFLAMVSIILVFTAFLKLFNILELISSKLIWNFFLRFLFQQHVTFYLASLINL